MLDTAGVSNVQSPGTAGFLFTPVPRPARLGVQAEPSTLPPIPIRIAPLPPAGQPPAGRVECTAAHLSSQQCNRYHYRCRHLVRGEWTGSRDQPDLDKPWGLWVDDGAVRLDLTTSKASAAQRYVEPCTSPVATQTISGSTNITTATGYNYIEVAQPTMSAASAMTITNAATPHCRRPAAGVPTCCHHQRPCRG